MLHINDLTYRIDGRTLFDRATAGIPDGHTVGLVGRNGTGKTTLLRLIAGEITPDDGSISFPKIAQLGLVSQEAPGGPESLIDVVLAADVERTALLAEAETCADPGRIGEVQVRLVEIDAYSAPARAASILSGLGFDQAAQQRSCASFSGGWRMRVALGAMLFSQPDILLLDEPTNYLDLEGAMWLEQFLRSYPHTCLIVSHDRDMLNRAVDSILHLDTGKLSLYTGGYDQFEETRREQQRLELKLKKKQDDARRHMQAFVDRFRAKATKAKQAQSRIKALERMQPIAAQVEDRVVPFEFPEPERALASPMIQFFEASVGYEPGSPVLRDLNLRIDQDDRIALLGSNGNGKSTFAKLLSGRLQVEGGRHKASKKLSIGYFAQHQLDDLNANASAYDHIAPLMPEATEAQKRARCAAIGFNHQKADTKAENLSGGEKARLLFALASFHGPHLMILDEPTNHLDVDSREALIHALNAYEGAVILISHDRHLIEATAERLWIVRDGTVTPYDGDMDQYRDDHLGRPARKSRKPSTDVASIKDQVGTVASHRPQLSKAEARKASADKREALAPLKKAATDAEREINALSAQIDALDLKLADPGLYERDPDQAQDLGRERGRLSKALGVAEESWLEASETYEAALAAQNIEAAE